MTRVPELVGEFLPTIEAGTRSPDTTTAAAWCLMREHTWYIRSLAEICGAAYEPPADVPMDLLGPHLEQLHRRHPRLHHVLDVRAAVEAVRSMVAD